MTGHIRSLYVCFICNCNAFRTFCAQFIFLFDPITSDNLQGVPEKSIPQKSKWAGGVPFQKFQIGVGGGNTKFQIGVGGGKTQFPRRARAGRELLKCWFKILRKGHMLLISISKGYFFLGRVFVCFAWMSELWPPSSCSSSWSINSARFCKTKAEDQRTVFFCLSGLAIAT